MWPPLSSASQLLGASLVLHGRDDDTNTPLRATLICMLVTVAANPSGHLSRQSRQSSCARILATMAFEPLLGARAKTKLSPSHFAVRAPAVESKETGATGGDLGAAAGTRAPPVSRGALWTGTRTIGRLDVSNLYSCASRVGRTGRGSCMVAAAPPNRLSLANGRGPSARKRASCWAAKSEPAGNFARSMRALRRWLHFIGSDLAPGLLAKGADRAASSGDRRRLVGERLHVAHLAAASLQNTGAGRWSRGGVRRATGAIQSNGSAPVSLRPPPRLVA